MKKKVIRHIAIGMCVVFAFAALRPVVSARAAAGSGMASAALEELQGTQEETIYVLTDSDGALRKIISSEQAANEDGSALSEADLKKELPIVLNITYKLNGKPITTGELAGKSGRVTVRFDYTNQQSRETTIDGKPVKCYVPFTVMTGMLLDNERFQNIEISNGKLIDDGGHTAVIGIAFPGLQENLAVDPDKLEIPSFVEMTADVQDFSMDMTISLVTNALFQELNTDELDSVGDLSESLSKMTDAMDQLMGGSNQLYDGLNTLLGKSGELVGGINQLATGAKNLKEGAGNLDEGAAALQAGAAKLQSGLDAVVSNNGALQGGATQVFNTLLTTANAQLAAAGLDVPAMSIGNYADVLNGAIASMDESAVYEKVLAAVTAQVEEQRDYITEQVAGVVRNNVAQQVTAAVAAEVTNTVKEQTAEAQEQIRSTVTKTVRETVENTVIQSLGIEGITNKAEYDAAVADGMVDEDTQAAVSSAIEEQMQSQTVLQEIETQTQTQISKIVEEQVSMQMQTEEVQGIIAAKTEEQMQTAEVQNLISTNTEAQVQQAIADAMESDAVQSQLAAASEGVKAVIALKTSLDSYNAFYLGIQSYTAGVAQAASGAGELKAGLDSLRDGSDKLSSGADALYNGVLTLNNGAPALVSGVTQLRDGALRLSDGLKEFDEKGVQALVDAVDGDVDNLLKRIRATVDVSREYQAFTESEEELDGQVKFVYRTDPVKKEK